VIWLQETLAIVHACLAQLFFALVVALAFFTSTEWAEESPRDRLPDALRVQRLGLVTTALIYLQAVAGAILRHTGAGLELHLLLAAAVAGHVALLAYRVLPVPTAPRGVRRCTAVLTALLLVQLGLGLGAYWVRFVAAPAPAVMVFFTTAHVVGGAALLAAAVALSLRSYRGIEGSEMTEGESIAGRRVSA
jgi:cytochrome c oxidase assembly protein subunit 15